MNTHSTRAESRIQSICLVYQSWVNCTIGLCEEELIWCFGYTCYATIYNFMVVCALRGTIDVIAAHCASTCCILELFESDSHSTFLNFACTEPIGELRVLYNVHRTSHHANESWVFAGRKKRKHSMQSIPSGFNRHWKKNYAVHAKSSLCLAPPVHSVPGQGISFMEYFNIF